MCLDPRFGLTLSARHAKHSSLQFNSDPQQSAVESETASPKWLVQVVLVSQTHPVANSTESTSRSDSSAYPDPAVDMSLLEVGGNVDWMTSAVSAVGAVEVGAIVTGAGVTGAAVGGGGGGGHSATHVNLRL
jgi:hypothetical protein